jgi:hypothetical protein
MLEQTECDSAPLKLPGSPLEFVRSRPELYTGVDRPDADLLVSFLIRGILPLTSELISVRRFEGWYLIACAEDWIALCDIKPDQCVFTQIVLFPEVSPSGYHPEVLLAAFGTDVLTATPEESRVITGQGWTDDLRQAVGALPEWKRLVAFRTSAG